MTPRYTIQKSSNSFSDFFAVHIMVIFVATLLGANGYAQFKSSRDRKIVGDILKTFQKECTQKGSSDSELISRIQAENKEARRAHLPEVEKCFEVNYSQIVGVYYLYTKLCSDVSYNPSFIPDSLAARQLLEVNKYKSGIRPYHSALNDCLAGVTGKLGAHYVIPLAGSEVDANTIETQINAIRISPPFAVTGVPFR